MTSFKSLVPYLETSLRQHHVPYSIRCKGELWEEHTANALKSAGLGSDWEPDFNHGVGVDQTTDSGIRISNKSGKLSKDNLFMEISGSRMTKYPTLVEKLEFLKCKHEDYIFCLATNEQDWKKDIKRYVFIVIDSNDLNYHDAAWSDMLGTKPTTANKIVGHRCVGAGYTAKIQKSMSDQIWTKINSSLFKEAYDIIV